MAEYILAADITDSALLEAGLSDKLTAKIALVNDTARGVEDMVVRKGAVVDEINMDVDDTDRCHPLIIRWGTAWVGRELCLDLVGKNKQDMVDNDVYAAKYGIYKKLVQELDAQINYEVILGTADTQRERPGPRTGTIFHGG